MGFAKARRDGPPPTPRPPSPLMLEFVDVQDPQARSRARSHVVRGWRRQNRLKDIRSQLQPSSSASNSAKSDDGGSARYTAQRSSSMPSLLPIKRQLDQLDENSLCKPSISASCSSAIPESRSPDKSEGESRCPSSALSSPITSVDSASTDPLSMLPMDLDERDREALEYFLGFLSSHAYNLTENSPYNPNRDLVSWSAKYSAPAMHAIISMSLIHLARLRGQDEPTLGMHHLGESMRLLRGQLVDVRTNLPDVMMTVCGLLCVTEVREEYQQSQVHIRAVVRILQSTSLNALNDHPQVQRHTAYITTAVFTSGLPDLRPHKTTESSQDHLYEGLNASEEVLEVHSSITDILKFISKIHSVTHKRTDENRSVRPRQKTLFHHNGLLYSILCNSETDHFTGGGLGNKRIHRASCLFLIALNLLEMADSPEESEEYLRNIQETYVKTELDVRPSLRLLHLRLIEGKDEVCVADVEKTWQMIRLIQVFKLLTWETGLRILTDIGDFLGMSTINHPRPDIGFQHHLSMIVNEVLDALTTDDERRKLGCIPRTTEGLPVEEPVLIPNDADHLRRLVPAHQMSPYG